MTIADVVKVLNGKLMAGDAASPRETISRNSPGSCAMPPPVPPSVKPGRTMSGHEPIVRAIA